MRRITIDAALSAKIDNFCKTLFDDRKTGLKGFIKPIKKLQDLKRVASTKVYDIIPQPKIQAYLDLLIKDYDKIIKANSAEIIAYSKKFDKHIKHTAMPIAFADEIIAALRYSDLREKEMLMFLQEMNYKACMYCHSQFTIIIVKKRRKDGTVTQLGGRLELDHFYAKSEFPFLATSFYNLIPICSNCNKNKWKTPSNFNVYGISKDLDLLNFKLKDKSYLNYWNSKDLKDIDFDLVPVNGNNSEVEDFDRMFAIKKIYEVHKDIVADLIMNEKIYNDPYNKTLVDNFEKLFPDQSLIPKLLIGNYDQPEDMLKRPLAKFVQEIARDINLIPPLVKSH